MRIGILAALLLAGTAMPAAAQDKRIDRRIEKLEGEMKAVQRKVFPGGGSAAMVQPEIQPEASPAGMSGVPAGSAVSDLNARVDALESQLARLTGQAEENANRLRQLDEAFVQLRASTEARMAEMTAPQATAAVPEAAPAALAQGDSKAAMPAVVASSGDPGEDAYLAGFRLWEGGRFEESHATLETMLKSHPKHRRASYARNLAGRALLDQGKPASAAKMLLANYQTNPKGDRAADSLYFLGQALVKLDKGAEACKVYDELREVYPTMRDWLRERLPAARKEAGCR